MSTLIDPARIAEETGLTYTFSSESVSEGHPDKVCDTIADSILDAYLAQDPNARVACEVLVKANQVVLAGEITSTALVDHEAQVREAVRAIGYTDADQLFHADTLEIRSLLSEQAPEIAQGVNAVTSQSGDQGAGDQGIMFGYATDETPELMPLPILLAHRLSYALAELRKAGAASWLRPDAKTQVSVLYGADGPQAVTDVLVSTQHSAGGGAGGDPPLHRADAGAARAAGVVPRRPAADGEPHRQLRAGRPLGGRGGHRPQDHRRLVRRDGAPRRRRVQRQGSQQGGPLGRLLLPLRRAARW
jgi:hypothetical protein